MKPIRRAVRLLGPALVLCAAVIITGCTDDDDDNPAGPSDMTHDPDSAPVVEVDRFSDEAATLMRRSDNPSLPGPDMPIDFDSGAPLLTVGLGPDGEQIRYYNFDVQPLAPAPIYVFFREGESSPVDGQLNIIDQIPGDAGYNDFWQVNRVTVPADYLANDVADADTIIERGYTVEATSTIVNCPVVPAGSTADLRFEDGDTSLTRGWYREEVVMYFNFSERALETTGPGQVPVSEIRVAFNVNPDEPGGGPASGFRTEDGSSQTHNVVQTLPSDAGYSPLWSVDVYDTAEFPMVHNWGTALEATTLAQGAALVNCPVVSVGGRLPVDPDTAPLASVDRFSDEAGTLFRRSENPALPGPNEPIDFDSGAPFLTRGLGPAGPSIQYYNFDVQPVTPAPIYVLVRMGESDPVAGQLNIIGTLPGDPGYNDFWRVQLVTVPADYVANTVTSFDQINAKGFAIQATDMIVNCPVVPDGSTATLRFTDETEMLHSGWIDGHVVKYFTFSEDAIALAGDTVPLADIRVCFNINPGEDGGGPPSGFRTETGSDQTHNVVAALPGDDGYSPLWEVDVYDNADFDTVEDWPSAAAATLLGESVATVNCPVVSMER